MSTSSYLYKDVAELTVGVSPAVFPTTPTDNATHIVTSDGTSSGSVLEIWKYEEGSSTWVKTGVSDSPWNNPDASAADQTSGDIYYSPIDGKVLIGTNSQWGENLQLGINSSIDGLSTVANNAVIGSTNGNLHVEPKTGRDLVLNFYSGGDSDVIIASPLGQSPNGKVGIGAHVPTHKLDIGGEDALRVRDYPDSRDDSATFSPVNFLYTDDQGCVLSGQIDDLPSSSAWVNTDGTVADETSTDIGHVSGKVAIGTGSFTSNLPSCPERLQIQGQSGQSQGLIVRDATTPLCFGTILHFNDAANEGVLGTKTNGVNLNHISMARDQNLTVIGGGHPISASLEMHSTLEVTGSVAKSIRVVSANTTAGALDYTIVVDTAGVTIALPNATLIKGRIYNIKNLSTGTITLDAQGAQLIDYSTTHVLQDRVNLTIQSDGTRWVVL